MAAWEGVATVARTFAAAMLGAGLAAAVLTAAACNPIVGFKDPKLDQPTQIDDAAIDTAAHDAPADISTITCPASCTFGCEADMITCRPAKLWVFQTAGQFPGNGFAGTGTAADVRKTADTKCFLAASDPTVYPDRGCAQAHTHAIITIDGTDAISVMANTFSIPTAVGANPVEIHRVDDDVLVIGSWGEFISSTTPLVNEAVSLAVGGTDTNSDTDNGLVWTGVNGSSTCSTWTSAGSSGMVADLGVLGRTRIKGSAWQGRGSRACNQLHHLLCVCWSAP
jgi:hypothetical protein